jgi:stress-induced morphogen
MIWQITAVFFRLSSEIFITSLAGELMKEMENRIQSKLSQSFNPSHLNVTNESYMHSVPQGSESHFKVVLVTDAFADKRQVQRHQAVYACLADELKNGVHALALHTFSPKEWQEKGAVPASPQCLGGSKHDHS